MQFNSLEKPKMEIDWDRVFNNPYENESFDEYRKRLQLENSLKKEVPSILWSKFLPWIRIDEQGSGALVQNASTYLTILSNGQCTLRFANDKGISTYEDRSDEVNCKTGLAKLSSFNQYLNAEDKWKWYYVENKAFKDDRNGYGVLLYNVQNCDQSLVWYTCLCEDNKFMGNKWEIPTWTVDLSKHVPFRPTYIKPPWPQAPTTH